MILNSSSWKNFSKTIIPTSDNVVNILELSCHLLQLLWWWTLNMETYDSMIWVMTSKRGARSAAAHNKLDCPTTTKNEVVMMVWLSNWLKFGYIVPKIIPRNQMQLENILALFYKVQSIFCVWKVINLKNQKN